MRNYILLTGGIVIAALAIALWWQTAQLAEEIHAHEQLRKSQTTGIQRLINRMGQERAITEVVAFSKRDFEAVNKRHIAALEKAFDTKIKRVQAVIRMSVTTSGKAAMPARDTLVILPRDSLPTKLKQYRYADNYFQLSAIADADSLHITHYAVRNDMTAVAHKGRRSPRWKFWKSRPIQCQVFLFNPNTGLDTLTITVNNGK